jgi:hypothetical protein
MSAINSDSGPVVTEQLIAHALGRAHRTTEAQNAPNEARTILHVARSFPDALAETDPLFDRARFIQTSTESIYAAAP